MSSQAPGSTMAGAGRSKAGLVMRLLRSLGGSDGPRLLGLLEDQLAATSAGVALVQQLAAGQVTVTDAHECMRTLEHQGDAARAALVGELSQVLSSPIDSEDLFRVSRSIDDVLDNLRDFVREVDLFGCSDLGFAQALASDVAAGVEALGVAIDGVRDRSAEVGSHTVAARKASGKVRSSYQHELARLFEGVLDAEVLKRRELLRRLDVVGLRLGEAADALADGALKRSR